MEKFVKEFQVIWADIDANRHMRHSAYNDYAAQVRLAFFSDNGFTVEKFENEKIGPILFREETVFLREIGMNEVISVDLQLAAVRKDATKWRIVHNIYKKDGTPSAIITVDGSWLDLVKRKITVPPADVQQMIDKMPKHSSFEFIPDKSN